MCRRADTTTFTDWKPEMFRELVDLGRALEERKKLPPTGFYAYGSPIRWIVRLWPDRVELQSVELPRPRPYSGRTSGTEAHLLADEAAYALGASHRQKEGIDPRAPEKHALFLELLRAFVSSEQLRDPALRQAVGWLEHCLQDGLITRDEQFGKVEAKDWVSFVPEEGPLKLDHLFEHADAKAFWIEEMQRRCAPGEGKTKHMVPGVCSVCGKEVETLVGKLPMGVKLAGTNPLHSLNADSFTSFIGGAATSKKAHLGICFACGDTASRAFNCLSDDQFRHRALYRHPHKRDNLANQTAFFWLKVMPPLLVGGSTLDLNEDGPVPFSDAVVAAPPAHESQLDRLLTTPFKSSDSAFTLDDYAFYLAILSPNVGRIAIREWIAVSLNDIKRPIALFRDSMRVIRPNGAPPSCASILDITRGLGVPYPDVARSLIRCAYTGVNPPASLVSLAARRLNFLFMHESDLRERQRTRPKEPETIWSDRWLHGLAAAIKLGRFYNKEGMLTMVETNPAFESPAYHSGRLLAVLEEAQQLYHWRRYGKLLDSTIVTRGYGGVSSNPRAVVPFIKIATMAHLPDVELSYVGGDRYRVEVENIIARIAELGGFPEPLSLEEQADFALGFYHQRAQLPARPPLKQAPSDS